MNRRVDFRREETAGHIGSKLGQFVTVLHKRSWTNFIQTFRVSVVTPISRRGNLRCYVHGTADSAAHKLTLRARAPRCNTISPK